MFGRDFGDSALRKTLAVLLLGLLCSGEAMADPPNIVVIVADDLGSADLGYRGGNHPTPNLDQLAAQGVRLEWHYVLPVCSPTRAALLSGRHPTRFGVDTPTNHQVFPFGTLTLAGALRSNGYRTGLVGKWHLGSKPDWGPNHFGFDHSYGLLAGGCGPYCHRYEAGPFSHSWHRDGALLEHEEGHVTDLVTGEAVRFIEAHQEQPFFLYVAYTAPHIPLDEPSKWLDENEHISNPGTRLFGAAVTHMDDGIGQIVTALRQSKLDRQTLVIFFSDNGAHGTDRNDREFPGQYPNLQIAGNNAPLRGGKGDLYEGGIRAPAIVWWPGRLPPRRVNVPAHVVDWMPTICRVARVSASGADWDGVDIWPAIDGEAMPSDRTLYWGVRRFAKGRRQERDRAIRRGDWKLIARHDGQHELFHLSEDPTEQDNLATKFPSRIVELSELLTQVSARDDDAKVPQ